MVLHVREPGYRGESRENTTENWRNANPLDYLKAIKAVTNAGGWVFRMGDSSMTPLPSMPQVIDYAHHEIQSDWMDVFLWRELSVLYRHTIGLYEGTPFFWKAGYSYQLSTNECILQHARSRPVPAEAAEA